MRTKASRFLAIFSILALVALPAIPALAVDRGDRGTVSPTSGPLEETFPSLTGQYPAEGAHFFAYFRPFSCRQNTYCDAHTFNVEVPENYFEIYGVRIILSWPNPESNDVSLHVWPNDSEAFGGPMAGCSQPRNCPDEHPLVAEISEPEGGQQLWITVVNVSGLNNGYTLRIEWFTEELPPLPDFSPPSSGGSGGFGSGGFGSGGSDSGTTGGFTTDGGSEPDVETTTIRVPGPDGELIEMELPVYTRAAGVEEEGGIPLLIPLTVALLLLAASAGGFFFFRARRRGEEDELATPTVFHY